MGDLAARLGRRRVLWIALAIGLVGVVVTLPDRLVSTVLGVAMVTWSFFGAHSIASSWVGLRANEGTGAGVGALSVLLLRRLQLQRLAGRRRLSALRLERRRRADRRAARSRLPRRAQACARAAAAPSAAAAEPMEWRDEGVVIGLKRLGESSAVLEAMTRAHGRHLGLVRGARSQPARRRFAARQHARPRLAGAARRASRRLRRRAADVARRPLPAERDGAGGDQPDRRAVAAAARARSA